MRHALLTLALLIAPPALLAAGAGYPLDSANIDLHNQASLQRGAKMFVNYCMGCHSAEYQRYGRMARDIGLTEEQVTENLVFTDSKIGDPMKNAMSKEDAKRWFGAPPPDLSVIARARGVDWLYTYLRTFYLDPTRPLGVNNAVFPDVGMPHVLWQLQGWQAPVYETETDAEGETHEVLHGFELVQPGARNSGEFDRDIRDLVNFLAYMGEPVQLERKALGIKVLLFLVLMTVVFYLLKKEYWRDIH
jgi:ubiquinol-cytochrome c reductase cytochrome c1 subunit